MAKSIYLEKAMLSDELMLAVEVSGYKQQWDEIIPVSIRNLMLIFRRNGNIMVRHGDGP